ncbi:MAG: hypothetical protein LBQ76_04125 [Candidatus Fibromonas sp.]|jgi:hypothetical protein|nr:hypothetical protein [Candidatus Fibromonas sp.]
MTPLKKEALGPFLDDEAVLKIARQRIAGTVFLAALDCNWTGKNRVNDEKDYLNVWVAVSFYQRKDKVFLHGARFSNWTLEHEMELVSTVENLGLFRLSLNNPDVFPNEFVIRLERETGEQIYDNNNFRNFYIEHNKGHFATAIAQGDSIFSFETITPIHIICHNV